MAWLKQILLTVLAVLLVLAAISQLGHSATIYDIDGMFAPSLKTTASSNFTGVMKFPGPTVQSGVLELAIVAEPGTNRIAPFNMSLNLPGTIFQPWDSRLFAGLYNDKPFTMLALDYDQTAGLSMDSSDLQGGGGWDAWLISFPDWPAGSIAHMAAAQVNEPCAAALGAVAFVFLLGYIRSMNRR